MTVQSINPTTGEVLASYDEMAPAAARDIVGEESGELSAYGIKEFVNIKTVVVA